jgi:hypothetical protein
LGPVVTGRSHLIPLAIAFAALVLAGLTTPAAEARRSQFTIFEAPRELASPDAAVRSRTFDEIEAFGVHWIRVVLYWNRVAPSPNRRSRPDTRLTDPDSYDWTSYERVIAEARARGVRVLVTPSGPVPRWATLTRQNHVDYPSPTYFYRVPARPLLLRPLAVTRRAPPPRPAHARHPMALIAGSLARSR